MAKIIFILIFLLFSRGVYPCQNSWVEIHSGLEVDTLHQAMLYPGKMSYFQRGERLHASRIRPGFNRRWFTYSRGHVTYFGEGFFTLHAYTLTIDGEEQTSIFLQWNVEQMESEGMQGRFVVGREFLRTTGMLEMPILGLKCSMEDLFNFGRD